MLSRISMVQKLPGTVCVLLALFTLLSSLLSRWFFAMISVSGMFAVTFSIAFAYVADCTEQSERSTAYGLVRFIPVLVTFMV